MDALLLFIVRGIGKKEALRASARVAAVYVPATLAAVAGAALGRSGRAPSSREPAPASAEGRSALAEGTVRQ